jgi:hypothetical protein
MTLHPLAFTKQPTDMENAGCSSRNLRPPSALALKSPRMKELPKGQPESPKLGCSPDHRKLFQIVNSGTREMKSEDLGRADR